MGRPFKTLTPAQIAEVETLAAILNTAQIADYFGIGRRTFYSMMQRDPDIAARYKKGRARAIGTIAQSLIAKARAGDTTSMIFYLKTQAGWRETLRGDACDVDPPELHQEVDLDLTKVSSSALLELTEAIDKRAARLQAAADGGLTSCLAPSGEGERQ